MGCHKAVKAWGLLGLRLAIGFIVAYLGYGKLGVNHAGTVAMMAGIGGAGMAEFLAYFVGTLEFVGGLMMIFGVYAPLAALWQSVILIVAMLTVHNGGPLMGYFLPLAVLGGCLGLIACGAGKFRLVRQQCPCPSCKAGCGMCGSGGGGCGDGGNCGCGSPGGSCGCCK